MAINDDLHRYKDVLKKQISHAFRIYLSIAIILSPLYLMNTANAASLGGWSIVGSTVQGASVVLNGTKELILNGAKKIAHGTAKITPPPSSVAKALAGGAAAVALDLAIKELLGGLDYVLDPQNNRIIYYPPQEPSGLWSTDGVNYIYTSGTAAALAKCAEKGQTYRGYDHNKRYALCTRTTGTNDQWSLGYIYAPPAEREEKYLPFPTVAQKVIDQAVAGSSQAQQVIRAAADTIVDEAQTDTTKARPIINEFEKTSTIETTEKSTSKSESTTTNTANPEESTTKTDTTTEFPVFCGWAPTICEAANVVIQKPQEWAEDIKAAYNDAVDYFKEEPTNKDPEQLEIEQPEFEAEQVNLQGSTDCPQDLVSFSLMGKSYTLEMPYQPVCNALDFFRPAVLAVGAITSAYIIAGIRTKEDET